MSDEVRSRAHAAYAKGLRLLAEAERQGREGEELHGEVLDIIERLEWQSGKEAGAFLRQAYERERQCSGRYFVAGLYLPLLLGRIE
jgi:hypothetical protein